jgi:hypothetical protein
MEGTKMQQQLKDPSPKIVPDSKKQEGIQQDCQADSQTVGCEVISRAFHQGERHECLDIVEGSACSETKGEMSKAQPSEKKDDGGTPGLPGTLSGNCLG